MRKLGGKGKGGSEERERVRKGRELEENGKGGSEDREGRKEGGKG